MTKKFPFLATIFTLIGVVILCSLGTWQVQRLQWKTDLLAQIEKENAKNPFDHQFLNQDLTQEKEGIIFLRGFVEGRFLHEREIAVGPRTYNGKSGYHIFTPLKIRGEALTILVNRGWISYQGFENLQKPVNNQVSVAGSLRKPDWNMFTPKNNPAQDRWFRLNTEEIAKAKDLQNLSPFLLYAEAIKPPLSSEESNSGGLIFDATAWQPRNKHFQYALFWYGMGFVLILVYGFWLRKSYYSAA